MCNYYRKEIKFPSNFHYEDCLSDLAQKGEVVPYHLVEDLLWTEIDDSSHYQRALESIYPKVIHKESN